MLEGWVFCLVDELKSAGFFIATQIPVTWHNGTPEFWRKQPWIYIHTSGEEEKEEEEEEFFFASFLNS